MYEMQIHAKGNPELIYSSGEAKAKAARAQKPNFQQLQNPSYSDLTSEKSLINETDRRSKKDGCD